MTLRVHYPPGVVDFPGFWHTSPRRSLRVYRALRRIKFTRRQSLSAIARGFRAEVREVAEPREAK